MPKKVKKQEVLEEEIIDVPDDISNDDDSENIEVEKQNEVPKEPVVKPKRVLSDLQKAALAKGREAGLQKLKAKHQLSSTKKAVDQQIKQIKEEAQVQDVEELKKIADISGVNKRVEGLYSLFNDIDSKISEMLEMKKKKRNNDYQKALHDEVKKEAREQVIRKTAGTYNRWLGKI